METDQDLIERIAAGDQSAFATVYHTHKNALFSVTYGMTRGQYALAEDILHDVFINFAKSVDRITLQGTLRSYLMMCCRNQALDHFRREQKKMAILVEGYSAESESADAVMRLAESEEQRQLLALLRRLPHEQHEVISMHLLGELTFQEIADICEVSTNTAKSRYRYGIAKVREWALTSILKAGD